MYNAKRNKKKFRKYEVCILEQTKHTPEDNDFFFFFKERGHTQSEEMNKTWQPVTTEY